MHETSSHHEQVEPIVGAEAAFDRQDVWWSETGLPTNVNECRPQQEPPLRLERGVMGRRLSQRAFPEERGPDLP